MRASTAFTFACELLVIASIFSLRITREIKSAAGDRGRETKAESGAQKGEGGTRVQLQRKGKREEGRGGTRCKL